MGTTNTKFRDQADSKNRIDATLDSSGARQFKWKPLDYQAERDDREVMELISVFLRILN